ncbi:MAG: PaaI family thioesterase [Proteobacteria bacterium]|nr:PaaI family thioesterase [Pseudomonadota bacterium]
MNEKKTAVRSLPGSSNLGCFGCSSENSHGLKMTFYTDGLAVFSDIKVPSHMSGWNQMVHGGILSVILDEIMSWAVLNLLKKMGMTKTMTIEFLKPVSIHDQLRAEGRPIETLGRHEAMVEGFVFNQKGELCAKSKGTFALLSAKLATRMGIVDQDTLAGIENIINA